MNNISQYFKSIVDQDRCAVVICDTKHKIVYMNPAACTQYKKHGGAALTGKNLLKCHNDKSNELIIKVLDWFKADISNNSVHSYFNEEENKDVYIIALRDESRQLIGYYEKHEFRNRDTQPFYKMDVLG